ncbi:Asp23/Gls24 family envelope stress response protein [Kribbella qitaiheensis]|uniref:Asp23/Gls24 family envelope stress response protein n=1 Tax=Kribbella qitaiheensis TaxID=1544730 RepID=A0A7G6WSA4_9ACTN|nr:Asp23/Gls24 family envelope stress response protein [Kribbella qitaiheensis]QNE16869.1 Asp23/Gls24 family envelope stress response protein [Kribbella qitaiheensis]
MADTALAAPSVEPIEPDPGDRGDPGGPGDRGEPGDRGALIISPRVVERIAEASALEARGVLRQEATFRHDLPKANALLAGQRARLTVEVAVEWGHPLAELAAEIRGRVGSTVTHLTGLVIDAVSVDISAVEIPSTKIPRRVE